VQQKTLLISHVVIIKLIIRRRKRKKEKRRKQMKQSRRSRRRGKCSDRHYIYYTENRKLIALKVRKQCPLVLQAKAC
jgi:hypothetical protein